MNARFFTRALRRFDEQRRTTRGTDYAHLGFFVRHGFGDTWIPVRGTRITIRDLRREGEDTLV